MNILLPRAQGAGKLFSLSKYIYLKSSFSLSIAESFIVLLLGCSRLIEIKEVKTMEQEKKTEASKETVETNKAAEIKLDNLPKKLTEEEAKNVSGGRLIRF
jgi:hypothetical protein